VVAHTFNPSTREAETGRFLSLKPAWATKSSRTARAIQRKPFSKKKTKNQNPKKKKKKKNRETTPFTIVTNNIKYLGATLRK
jgi:hypothetical protein